MHVLHAEHVTKAHYVDVTAALTKVLSNCKQKSLEGKWTKIKSRLDVAKMMPWQPSVINFIKQNRFRLPAMLEQQQLPEAPRGNLPCIELLWLPELHKRCK